MALPERVRGWPSEQSGASDSRHTGRSNTQHTELSAQSTKTPVQVSDGQCQIDGNHTLSFRIFMRTSNLNFQVHMTISKSDKQCSQTVHL